jgi:hypothetical protein
MSTLHRATVNVEPIVVDTKLIATIEDLNRKGFIKFPKIDIVNRQASCLQ